MPSARCREGEAPPTWAARCPNRASRGRGTPGTGPPTDPPGPDGGLRASPGGLAPGYSAPLHSPGTTNRAHFGRSIL